MAMERRPRRRGSAKTAKTSDDSLATTGAPDVGAVKQQTPVKPVKARRGKTVDDDVSSDDIVDDGRKIGVGSTDDKKREEKKAKTKKDDSRLPADYVGGVDPLAILALFFSGVPIVGLVLGVLSYRRYKNRIYDDGRFLALIAIIIGIIMLVVGALSILAAQQFANYANMMQSYSTDYDTSWYDSTGDASYYATMSSM